MVKPLSFHPSGYMSDRDTLLVTLFIAAIVHVALILNINFTVPKPPKATKSIDVTLVVAPSKKAPDSVRFLAPQNQVGAGKQVRKAKPSRQTKAGQGRDNNEQQVKRALIKASPKAKQKVITQRKSTLKQLPKTDKSVQEKTLAERRQLSPEMLRRQIAQLGTEIGFGKQGSDANEIKFVNIASARQYGAAQYLNDWENKVERTGNLNYPEAAIKKGFSSSLTMDVGLKSDGGIYSIKIRKSSGNPALDQAAKRIVRMSAPFPPLPSSLLNELKLKQQDVLIISRVWIFSDESGMTAK